MAEAYLALPRRERLDALRVAATRSGRAAHLLEKDVWVVWAIDGLFSSDFGRHLVFKGGTSLSKGYGIIRRFSEDIDVTYDVRRLIPELVGGGAPIPRSSSQADKWRAAIDVKLAAWVRDTALPALERKAVATEVEVEIAADGEKIYIDYDPLAKGTGYVPPRVTIEFGARSTGEPFDEKAIGCDAAAHLPELVFPAAQPRVMRPERTFWEKATAVHVFCARGTLGDRYSRHWHDLVRLDDAGRADAAIADRALADQVASFKSRFFRTKDRGGNPIDYAAAVNGNLWLVPDAETLKALEADYRKMAEDGILLDDAEPFEELIKRCAELERRANAARGDDDPTSRRQSD
jgi:hypothetical protein